MAVHLVNASASVEACRAVLIQMQQPRAALALRGLEVMDVATARMALGILRGIPVYGAIAGAAKQEAISVLEQATSDNLPSAVES